MQALLVIPYNGRKVLHRQSIIILSWLWNKMSCRERSKSRQMRKKENLYPMNNTVDETVQDYTTDPRKQKVKKQKIKRSTTKQLRNEAKQLRKGYNEDSKDI